MTRSQTPHDPADPFLTTREAALLLGVSLRSVQLWVEAGTLQAGRTPGGHRRIRTSDVHALAQKMGIKTAEPAANPLQTQLDDTRRQIAERDELIATLRARLFVPDIGAEPVWSTVDGAVAWHLIDRSGDGWGHIGAMMDAWRDAHPELARLRAELADYKRRARHAVSFLAQAEAVCSANAVDIRQLRVEVEQLQSHLDAAKLSGVTL